MEQFQVLPIEKVFESPLNPRKHFNEKKMAELVESIRAKGILVPLLVRPINISLNGVVAETRFEIAAGHRRYRAGIAVGLKEIPLIIRDMNDADFLEVLIIENDQHEDLEPLEQARGYQTLLEQGKYDIPAIALKISKSESYVYQRIKLLELIAGFQELLTNGKITAGHAILIARLQLDQQKELIKEGSGLYAGWGPDRAVVSVRDLGKYIERQFHLDLNSASFKKSDPDLVPEAGPCTTCQKRTGFVPTLFPEIKKKDTCTDPRCFRAKVEAFTEIWIAEKSELTDQPPLRLSQAWDGRIKKLSDDPKKPIPQGFYHEIEGKKDRCNSVQEGIMVDGHEQGQIKQVCVDPKCEKHHHGGSRYNDPESIKWKAEQKARDEKRKRAEAVRLRIMDAILPAAGDLSRNNLVFLAEQLFDELWDEYRKKILARHEIKPVKIQHGFDQYGPMKKFILNCNTTDLARLLMEMALIRHCETPHWTDKRKPDPLLETARRYRVDPKKIEAELKAEAKEKKAVKTKKKSASVKQKKKAKRGDPPKASTIPMKDLCKLHGQVKKKTIKDSAGETAEIRIPVDPKFLATIDRSYSGDLLANGGNKIRNPFEWEGDFYVCLGGMSSAIEGDFWKEAWKVMPADLFEGKTYGYDELMAKWNRNEKERGNENGRRVLLRNKHYVLEGPKIVFFDPKLDKNAELVKTIEAKPTPGVCRECGCTEEKPCSGGCAWTDKTKTLCTACQMAKEHLWEKQNLVTVAASRKVPMHDIYKCKKCGAMAKRFGAQWPPTCDKPNLKECLGVQTSAKAKDRKEP